MSSIYCGNCNIEIKKDTSLYKGYDLTFCSPTCRCKKINELDKLKTTRHIMNSSYYILEEYNRAKFEKRNSYPTIPKSISSHQISVDTNDLDNFCSPNHLKSIYDTTISYICFISGVSFTVLMYNLQVIYNEFTS